MLKIFNIRHIILFLLLFTGVMPEIPGKNVIFFGIFLYLISDLISFKKIHLSKYHYIVYGFFAFWLIIAIFSSIWGFSEKLKMFLLFWFLFLSTTIFMTQLIENLNDLKFIFGIICFMVILELVFALFEFFSHIHLPTSRYYGSIIPVPTGGFYNENTYSFAVMLMLPVFFSLIYIFKSIFVNIFVIISTLIFFLISILQGTRLTIVILPFFLIAYFRKSIKYKNIIFFMGTLILILILFSIISPFYSKLAMKYLGLQISSLSTETTNYNITSMKIRKQLFLNGLKYAQNFHFMGAGPSGFDLSVSHYDHYKIDRQANAHFYLMELFVNFGIIFIIFFLSIIFFWIYQLHKICKRSSGFSKEISRSLKYSLFLYLFINVLPGSLSSIHLQWIFFGLVTQTLFILDKKNELNNN